MKERRIGHDMDSVAGALDDDLHWCRDGAINIAEGALCARDGDILSFPQKKFLPREADGDQVGDGNNGGGAGRGHRAGGAITGSRGGGHGEEKGRALITK